MSEEVVEQELESGIDLLKVATINALESEDPGSHIDQLVGLVGASGWEVDIKKNVYGGKFVGKYEVGKAEQKNKIKIAADGISDERIIYEVFHEFNIGQLAQEGKAQGDKTTAYDYIDERIDEAIKRDLEVAEKINDEELRKSLVDERNLLLDHALRDEQLRFQVITSIVDHS